MKHISVIATNAQKNLSGVACIVGIYEMWTEASDYWSKQGNQPASEIEIVATDEHAEFGEGLISIKPHKTIEQVSKTDLIIIPAVDGDIDSALKENKPLLDWIAKHYKEGAEVAAMCSGAFLLASTGLLDGNKCSTHWRFAESFKTRFPKVKLQTDLLITDEQGIYTNGGGYSFLNLLIYLVEKYFDRRTAIYCSKVFQVEIDRHSQSVFRIFNGQKRHGDELVRQAQLYMENNVDERFSMETLSAKLSIGRRNFDRRFIKATGNTPVEYLQRVKVESAKKAFESTRKSINDVMYELGYSDVKAFRELFRRFTGISPQEYRNKYNKDTTVS